MNPIFLSTWSFGKLCVERAYESWNDKHDLADAIEDGIAAVELDPSINSVGLGGFPNAEGVVELDASFMLGDTLQMGAVAGVRNIVPVIRVARKVLENTPHVMLVGSAAEEFAKDLGFKPSPLLTAYTINAWKEWITSGSKEAPKVVWSVEGEESHDTVCLLGLKDGKFVGGCATSGVAWKLPGRVGDSPIIGAGLYVDDEAGAAAATGLGEEIWRFLLSKTVVENMRYGMTAQEACEQSLIMMLKRKPENRTAYCAVIAIDREGNTGAATVREGFFAPQIKDGVFDLHPITALAV